MIKPGMAITPALGDLLGELVQSRTNVLEFGAGRSSVVLARAGKLTSLETKPEWCREPWGEVEQMGIDAELVPTTLALRWQPYPHYRMVADIKNRGPFDFVFVDAPQWYYGRDGALPLCWRYLTDGALVVVDDAGRPQERGAIMRWARTYRLRLVHFDPRLGNNGVAILKATNIQQRFNLKSWVGGFVGIIRAKLVRIKRGK